jgi:hypothetical protein
MRRNMPAPAPAPPPGAPPGTPPVNYILLAGEGSSPPIKITQQDAQRIQEDTGLPPAQLEDNDLQESMKELNIHSVPLTPQDQQMLGIPVTPTGTGSTTVVQHSTPPPAPAAAPMPPPGPANPQAAMEQQLESLQDMKNKGLISDSDYEAKKKQVLGL